MARNIIFLKWDVVLLPYISSFRRIRPYGFVFNQHFCCFLSCILLLFSSCIILKAKSGVYTVGDFMTRKEDLHVVKPTTTVDEGMFQTSRWLFLRLYCKYLAFPMYSDGRPVCLQTALEILVVNRITGFPVIDDDWKLVTFPYPTLSRFVFCLYIGEPNFLYVISLQFE